MAQDLSYEQYLLERNMLTYGGAHSTVITYEEWKKIKSDDDNTYCRRHGQAKRQQERLDCDE